MDCSPPASSVHTVFQAGILEWIAISFSRGSDPDIESRYPTMQADCLPSELGTCQSWTPTIPQKLGGKGSVFFDVYIPEMGPALEKHLKVVPLVPILQMRTQRLSYLPE